MLNFAYIVFIALINIISSIQDLNSTLAVETPNVSFGISQFDDLNSFYLGATSENPGENALAHVVNTFDADDQVFSLVYQTLAPARAILNQYDKTKLDLNDQSNFSASPIYNQTISSMTINKTFPLVVPSIDVTNPILGPNQKICAVGKEGKIIYTTQSQLNDAAGLPCNGIMQMISDGIEIFVALKPNGGNFGDPNSGIGIVFFDSETGTFNLTNAVSGDRNGNLAVKIDPTLAGQQIAIEQDAVLGQIVDMHWDSSLNRLFIALQASTSNPAADGGAVALLVGRVNRTQVGGNSKTSKTNKDKDKDKPPANNVQYESQLILEPAVGLNPSNFATNSSSQIIGFFSSGDSPSLTASIYKVRTLTTSTNRAYVIINGGVSTTVDTNNTIYAMPVVKPVFKFNKESQKFEETNTADTGKIANKYSSGKQAVTDLASFTTTNDPAAIVGAGPLPLEADGTVQQIFTVGDSVFVALAGDSNGNRSVNNETGIFQSAAIINQNGDIAYWTPWQRVMGSIDAVFNAGIEKQTATYMYLTNSQNTTNIDTVKATVWSNGANDGLLGGTQTDASVGLIKILSSQMPQNLEGINQLFNFDQTTPTFQAAGTEGSLSLMVATGYAKIILAQTGIQPGSADPFTPISGNFFNGFVASGSGIAPNPNPLSRVMVIYGGVLSDLGPICCCEISRANLSVNTSSQGWIFVGGPNGLAVLSDMFGNGWNTTVGSGLASGFTGINNSMQFKMVGNFTNVRAIQSDNQYLYILTINGLFKMELNSSNFSATGAANPTFSTIASTSSSTFSNQLFLDFIVSSQLGILATSQGVFRTGNGVNIQTISIEPNAMWTEVQFNMLGGSVSLGPTVNLSTLPKSGSSFANGGNLFTLISDFNTNLSRVIRFYVNDTSSSPVDSNVITQVSETSYSQLFFVPGFFRNALVCDGAFGFLSLPKNYKNTNFLIQFSFKPFLVNSSDLGTIVPLSLGDPNNFNNIGVIRKNTASGAYMVPGDFGIQVNE